MEKEEYNQLKAQAHKQMMDDYQWMLRQEPAAHQWRCSKKWLIEFVHDVSDQALLQKNGISETFEKGADSFAPWRDDLFRPLPLHKLYEDFFAQAGVPLPTSPAKALNKLRAMEQRRSIYPDSITLFYMEQISKQPSCRIIELLMLT